MSDPVQSKYSAAQLIERYIQLRDDKAALAAAQSEQMKPYNTALDTIEVALQDMLNQSGGQSIKTPHGTAYIVTTVSAKVEDWPAFVTFVQETGDTELLVRNVNKTRFTELGEGGVVVPGVSTSSSNKVNVRRS